MPLPARDAMPPQLARRPLFRGYPVPFTTLIGPDGVPDFKVTDEAKREEVLRRRMCALCGEPLGYWIAFIGSETLIGLREFYDPAMHEACARYAAQTCPFLALSDAKYATPRRRGVTIEPTHHLADVTRPKRMGLYLTRTYAIVPRRISATSTVLMVRAGRATSIDWEIMPEGSGGSPSVPTAGMGGP
ncbi:MAG: hypothetical protein FJ029_14525 [Actinobacteria bacterium]|nr:hypothetical protein [Actinomycetota bacterium]